MIVRIAAAAAAEMRSDRSSANTFAKRDARAILILSARYGTRVGSKQDVAPWNYDPYVTSRASSGSGDCGIHDGSGTLRAGSLPSCVDCKMTLQFLAGTFSVQEMKEVAKGAWLRAGSPTWTDDARGRKKKDHYTDGAVGEQAGVEVEIDMDSSAQAHVSTFAGGARGRGPWRGGSALRVHAKPLSSLLGVYNPSLLMQRGALHETDNSNNEKDGGKTTQANSLRVRWVEGFPSKPMVFEATFYDMEEVVVPAPRGRAQCIGPWNPWSLGLGVE